MSSLCRRLEILVEEDAHRERTLQMGILRSLSSEKEYALAVKQVLPVYSALEEALDAQVKALDDDDEATLKDFSSGAGAAAQVWRDFGDTLRREDILRDFLTKRGFFAADIQDLELLPPASRQYVRRIRAAATLDGDLLLGHLYLRYALIDLRFLPKYFQPWSSALQFPSLSRDRADATTLDSLLQSIDQAAEPLDDDKHTAIAIEAQRACELNAKLITERNGLTLDAARGAFKLSLALIQKRLAPSLTSHEKFRSNNETFTGAEGTTATATENSSGTKATPETFSELTTPAEKVEKRTTSTESTTQTKTTSVAPQKNQGKKSPPQPTQKKKKKKRRK